MHDLHEAGVNIRTPPEPEVLLPPIELFIDPKLRDKTIEKIFHGNPEEYKRLVTLLNRSKDVEKAMLNLETTLKLQRFNENSKLAKRLREATALRFHKHIA
jgi:hypothetical protein